MHTAKTYSARVVKLAILILFAAPQLVFAHTDSTPAQTTQVLARAYIASDYDDAFTAESSGNLAMPTPTATRTNKPTATPTPVSKVISPNSGRTITQQNGAWNIQCVVCPKYFGLGNRAIRVDAAGRPRIAYGGDHLYYAWYDGAAWQYQTVDASSVSAPSLALDAAGNPHLSYTSDTGLKYARWTGVAWITQTVDATPNVYATSLALDAGGNPHISYYKDPGYLKYARWTGAAWSTETVDTGQAGGANSLALDALGNPHISYTGLDFTSYQKSIKYARWTGGAWIIETVATGVGDNVKNTSLALDAAGTPHIAYHGLSSAYSSVYKLFYARRTGGVWGIQIVDDGLNLGPNGGDASLVLDSNGRPHISYDDEPDGNLKYARWTGNNWAISIVENIHPPIYCVGAFGYCPNMKTALALDGDSNAHIAYFDFYFGILRYARWTGNAWQTQTVDTSTAVRARPSLALDGAGRPHISFDDGSLKYARWTGNAWNIQTVDATRGVAGTAQGGSSLALDGAANPHISYLDYNTRDLKHAYFSGNVWHTETVDSAVAYGNDNSIALDAAGNPRISYYKDTLSNFPYGAQMYARWTGNAWIIETVDPNSTDQTAMVLDGNGNPHISYQNDYWHLMYARWTGNAWDIQTVDNGTNVGYDPSLALDGNGNAHISYTQPQGGVSILKYARWTGGGWQIQTVDGGYLRDTSLALDSSGNPHISYWDDKFSSYNLKYAYWTGNAWSIQVIDSLGRAASLALDSRDNPHISYTDANFDLKYAYVPNPIPTTTSISPTSARAGDPGFLLTVNGTNFVAGSTVKWDGADRVTNLVNSTQLTANITAADITLVGAGTVTVFNPAPGGGTSNPQTLFITQTGANVTASNTASGNNPTASTSNNSVSAAANGSGTVSVAQYGSNPGGTPSFSSTDTFMDVNIATGNTFDSVTITFCNLNGGTQVYWWNGNAWQLASDQSYNAATGCVTVTVTNSTTPSLSDLTGTPFGAARSSSPAWKIYLPLILR